MASKTILLLAVALCGTPLVRGEPTAPGPDDPATLEFVRLVNEVRVDNGCRALRWDDDVAKVARRHSQDMITREFFDHTNPDGKSPFDRLKAGGIKYNLAGENILFGTKDGKRALALWLDSPPHRSNIMLCRFEVHGVARVDGHWTHLFTTPP